MSPMGEKDVQHSKEHMGMFGFGSRTRCLLHPDLQALLQRGYWPFVPVEPQPRAVCGWRETKSHMHSVTACDTDATGSPAPGGSPAQGWHVPSEPLPWGAHR